VSRIIVSQQQNEIVVFRDITSFARLDIHVQRESNESCIQCSAVDRQWARSHYYHNWRFHAMWI